MALCDFLLTRPKAQVQLPERAYCMDVQGQLMVVGCANRQVCVFNLQNPGQIMKTLQSPLKHQTRCVGCFTTGDGFAIGSIEGRCGIQYVTQTSKNFAFKCHRNTSSNPKQIFAVNAIAFSRFGTFATVGADGKFNFWDKDSKQRLKQFPAPPAKMPQPIPCCAFNAAGNVFAYASSYDWSKGAQHYQANNPQANKLFLHHTPANEIQPKRRK